MGISDFGMQIAGKEGSGLREKQLKVPVGSLQLKQETMQDAGYRMHEGNANPKFEARNQKKFK